LIKVTIDLGECSNQPPCKNVKIKG